MQRREFIKTAGTAAVSASAVGGALQQVAHSQQPALLQANSQPVLVKIFLRGGQDQLNTIVPHKDKTYYDIRPTIAIPAEDVLRLDDRWGFHPAMKPLKPFYDSGRMAVIINSGSPHPTRSHFDAQDFMEYAAPGNRTIRDGWLNRYLQAAARPRQDPKTLRALAMQERLPRSMRGTVPVLAVPPNLREIDEVLDLFEDFYRVDDPKRRPAALGKKLGQDERGAESKAAVDPVMASGMQTVEGLRRLRDLLYGKQADPTYQSNRPDDLESTVFQEYPGTWFASRLQALARAIKANVGLEVATTDINGWDHHIGLGSTDGTLNRMLAFLAEGLAAFMKDLGPDLDRTLILVCTEFGRVAKENGNDGSDHGHGGAAWLLGGNVKGGRILGEWSGLESSQLNEKRDLKVSTDFRDIFAEVLRKHMRIKLPDGFFPGYQPTRNLGLFS